MTRTQLLQELRRTGFEEAYGGWPERRLTEEERARLLGVTASDRHNLWARWASSAWR